MSTTVNEGTQHSIHLKYPDVANFVGRLGSYFIEIDRAWELSTDLASRRYSMFSSERPGELVGQSFWFLEESEELRFARIQLTSPLDITLAIQAVGGTGITICALHLLSAVLRDPERIGAWLPRLAVGWYRARKEAELARPALQQREASPNDLPEDVIEEHDRQMKKAELINNQVEETVAELVDLSDRLRVFVTSPSVFFSLLVTAGRARGPSLRPARQT